MLGGADGFIRFGEVYIPTELNGLVRLGGVFLVADEELGCCICLLGDGGYTLAANGRVDCFGGVYRWNFGCSLTELLGLEGMTGAQAEVLGCCNCFIGDGGYALAANGSVDYFGGVYRWNFGCSLTDLLGLEGMAGASADELLVLMLKGKLRLTCCSDGDAVPYCTLPMLLNSLAGSTTAGGDGGKKAVIRD